MDHIKLGEGPENHAGENQHIMALNNGNCWNSGKIRQAEGLSAAPNLAHHEPSERFYWFKH